MAGRTIIKVQREVYSRKANTVKKTRATRVHKTQWNLWGGGHAASVQPGGEQGWSWLTARRVGWSLSSQRKGQQPLRAWTASTLTTKANDLWAKWRGLGLWDKWGNPQGAQQAALYNSGLSSKSHPGQWQDLRVPPPPTPGGSFVHRLWGSRMSYCCPTGKADKPAGIFKRFFLPNQCK